MGLGFGAGHLGKPTRDMRIMHVQGLSLRVTYFRVPALIDMFSRLPWGVRVGG